MKINFDSKAIKLMYEWLEKSKNQDIRDESELRNILNLDEYKIEFERYNLDNLPVCKISYEEAVDFFMNFDKKEFSNQRLNYKQKSFIDFYNNLIEKKKFVELFEYITEDDINTVISLLKEGLPEELLDDIGTFNILLIISIGNSMGWPYKNYIDFDVANMECISDRNTFVHIIAHEIYHTFFGSIIKTDDLKGDDLFALNFAFEGLAVHYCNNAKTCMKPSKYNSEVFCINEDTWDFFDKQYEELFVKFKTDYHNASKMSLDEVSKLVDNEYETFEFKSLKTGETKKVMHYPTYYLGAWLYGTIDLAFGSKAVFDVLKNPDNFAKVYNEAAIKTGNGKFLL